MCRNLLDFGWVTGVAEPLVQASLLGEAVEHGPAAVFVADENGRYVAVNQAACRMLGYSREELLGLGVTDVANDTARWAQMLVERRVSGTSTLTRKDGSTGEF